MRLLVLACAFTFCIAPRMAAAERSGPIAMAAARESARLARQIAQAPADGWENVRAIDPDTRVVVTTRVDGFVSGRFLGADAVALTLDRGDRIAQIPADDIVEVKTVGRSIGRGAGIGAALGATVTGALILPKINSGDESVYGRVNLLPILTGVGAGLGAAVGARESTKIIWARTPGTDASSR